MTVGGRVTDGGFKHVLLESLKQTLGTRFDPDLTCDNVLGDCPLFLALFTVYTRGLEQLLYFIVSTLL